MKIGRVFLLIDFPILLLFPYFIGLSAFLLILSQSRNFICQSQNMRSSDENLVGFHHFYTPVWQYRFFMYLVINVSHLCFQHWRTWLNPSMFSLYLPLNKWEILWNLMGIKQLTDHNLNFKIWMNCHILLNSWTVQLINRFSKNIFVLFSDRIELINKN